MHRIVRIREPDSGSQIREANARSGSENRIMALYPRTGLVNANSGFGS